MTYVKVISIRRTEKNPSLEIGSNKFTIFSLTGEGPDLLRPAARVPPDPVRVLLRRREGNHGPEAVHALLQQA